MVDWVDQGVHLFLLGEKTVDHAMAIHSRSTTHGYAPQFLSPS
jgi:hypothetical protein